MPDAVVLGAGEDRDSARLDAAVNAQVNGFHDGPADFTVFAVDDTVVALPPNTLLRGVVQEEGHVSAAIEVLTPAESRTRPAGTAQALTGMTTLNGSCGTIENNTGWMHACWELSRSASKVTWSGKKQYLTTLEHKATHKSKGLWVMKKARVRAVPQSTDSQWVGYAPSKDQKLSECRSNELSVEVKGVGVSQTVENCDKWDVGLFPNNPGRFDNTWFGSAWRSERDVAYTIGVARPSGSASFLMYNDFWANL